MTYNKDQHIKFFQDYLENCNTRLREWEQMTLDRLAEGLYSLKIVTDKKEILCKPKGESVQKALNEECNAYYKLVLLGKKRLARYQQTLHSDPKTTTESKMI